MLAEKSDVFLEKWESELTEWNRVLDSLENAEETDAIETKKEQLITTYRVCWKGVGNMKKVNGHEIITLFEQWSPKRFAMEGDPVGLHIGQLNRPVEKVLVTLDVNEEVIDEAIRKGKSYYRASSAYF